MAEGFSVFGGLGAAPMPASTVLSVSDLNRLARQQLEATFPLGWVAGEVSNLTYAASGHVYFSLKDSKAQVRCAMWRQKAQLLGFRLENGQKVEVRALVTLYEPRGEFQLTIETVRRAGQGNLFEAFLRLKAQLAAEGLFAPEKKRPLPAFPRRVGIITSRQAAALQDVLTTLKRRAPQLEAVIFPTLVQGNEAAPLIASAIAAAGQVLPDGQRCDVLILCRGGGSLEDLWAFNEEAVARAIVASPVPVVAGIGHETDFCIADFAADLRAPTPTAAAEQICPEREALLQGLVHLQARLQRAATQQLTQRMQQLDMLARRLTHPAEQLQRQREHLQRLQQRLSQAAEKQGMQRHYRLQQLAQRLHARKPQTEARRLTLNALEQRLNHALQRHVQHKQSCLLQLEAALRQLDPLAILGRGYAAVRDASGNIIQSTAQLALQQTVNLQFAQGAAAAVVTQLMPLPKTGKKSAKRELTATGIVQS